MATPLPRTGWLDAVQADLCFEDGAPLGAVISLRRIRPVDLCWVFGEEAGIAVSVAIDGRPRGLVVLRGLSARGALLLLRLLVEGWHADRDGFQPLDAPPGVFAELTS